MKTISQHSEFHKFMFTSTVQWSMYYDKFIYCATEWNKLMHLSSNEQYILKVIFSR